MQCVDLTTRKTFDFSCYAAPCDCPAGSAIPVVPRSTSPKYLPPTPNAPALIINNVANCRRHQAPPNFTYVWNGVTCVLTPLNNPFAIVPTATPTPTATATGLDLSNLTASIEAHPLLLLAGIGALAYMIFGKKDSVRARESVVTTHYK